MEIDTETLTTCEIAADGGAISLGFIDSAGRPATVTLSLNDAGSLAMTLPGLITRALRTRFGDRSLRPRRRSSESEPGKSTFDLAQDRGRRHGRACPGHPRLSCFTAAKTWMPGTSPGMTNFAKALFFNQVSKAAPAGSFARHPDGRWWQ
jgi:hypothetical protein